MSIFQFNERYINLTFYGAWKIFDNDRNKYFKYQFNTKYAIISFSTQKICYWMKQQFI